MMSCLPNWTTRHCIAIRSRSGVSLRSGCWTASGSRDASPQRSPTPPNGLADQTGCDETRCRSQLQAFLMLASRPANERGGVGDRAFLAFKLHRFISGAGHVYATLRGSGQRHITLDGQRFDPEDQEARLYSTFFC
jgi:hypothetical protein